MVSNNPFLCVYPGPEALCSPFLGLGRCHFLQVLECPHLDPFFQISSLCSNKHWSIIASKRGTPDSPNNSIQFQARDSYSGLIDACFCVFTHLTIPRGKHLLTANRKKCAIKKELYWLFPGFCSNFKLSPSHTNVSSAWFSCQSTGHSKWLLWPWLPWCLCFCFLSSDFCQQNKLPFIISRVRKINPPASLDQF